MNWYCLQTRPLKEVQTANYLAETLGLETYFPRLKREKVIRRVRRAIIKPLFPRYLFCRFDPAFQYRAARYAPDVIDVVRFGEGPAIVQDAIIQDLKLWAGEAVDVITIEPPLAPGDEVVVIDGPMRGLHALVMRDCDDRDRVTVLLEALEWGAQVNISRSQLQKVS